MNVEGLGKYLCLFVELVMAFLTLRNGTSICTVKEPSVCLSWLGAITNENEALMLKDFVQLTRRLDKQHMYLI